MLRRLLILVALVAAAGLAQAGEAARVEFSAGEVRAAGSALKLGSMVNEGDEVVTGADGYVYLKTVDNGFLILRPNSRARIVSYKIDAQNPANTRIKLELLGGVARSISGDAVKRARQNFRFNTPVAAIGVRGTDFTVYTDQETSRVAVISGGVVVSGFADACRTEGTGPCEGKASLELFAHQAGQILQVRKGQAVPQLLSTKGMSPDVVAPPRADEPPGKSSDASSAGLPFSPSEVSLDPHKNADLLARFAVKTTPPSSEGGTPSTPSSVTPGKVIWGRWQSLLMQSPTINLTKLTDQNARLLALNSYFAILRGSGAEWQAPTSGNAGFALQQSDAYILDETTRLFSKATLENGKLQVNFAKSSFATSFDLVSQKNERFAFNAIGDVGRDGQLYGASQLTAPTNMSVSGLLGPENGGIAAYIFQGRVDDRRLATGLTVWGKQ